MEEANRRQGSGESRRNVAKSLGINKFTLRKQIKAVKYLQISCFSTILRAHEVTAYVI